MLAFNATLPPAQNVVEVAAVMVAVGRLFTVTVIAEDVAEQLLAFVTTNVYEPSVDAVFDAFVAPLISLPFNLH